jgi:putative colanic acid biosynthesis glycosyltransferase
MPKLLQINVDINSGSVGRIAEQIGEMAIANGWESYIAYARDYQPSKSNTIKIGNYLNIYYHVIQTRLFDNHCLSSTKATWNFIKKIEEIKPDIIQIHQLHGYYINVKVLFEYLSKINIPIIWTLHDCWAMTGHCTHFININCYKWKHECHHCPKKRNYPASIFLDRSQKNFHLKKALFTSLNNLTIVTVSDWLKNLAKESFLSKYPIISIKNGVDTRKFIPYSNTDIIKQKYLLTDKFIIMGVGTIWDASKGLFDYYKLREKLSNDYIIVLVGLSQEIIKNLPEGIVGIPRTESIDELAQLYSAADVITSLSNQEAFGLTPIEGFACGTPAIVYNATALPELITPEVGYIVEPGNIEQIDEAVNQINLKGKSYYSANCRILAEAVYDTRKKYGEYISLYIEKLKT